MVVAMGLAAFVPPAALALDPAKLPSQYIHDRWQDELPQSHVQSLLQTRDGYLWIATQEGLVRFDGHRFVVFDARNTDGLASSFVRTLLEGSDGSLWIGTRGGGVSRYRNRAFEQVTAGHPVLAEASIHALAEGPGGELWVGTGDQGLWRLDGEDWRQVDAHGPLAGATVLSLLPTGSKLWVGTRKQGLGLVEGDRFTAWSNPDPKAAMLAHESILSLLEDRAGTIWVGTLGHGLARLEGDDVRLFTSADGLPGESVKALLEDHDGNLWIGTYGGGLARLTAGRWSRWNAGEGLGSDVVLSLFEDREGSLWIGTEGGGLDRLMDGTFTPVGTPEGLGANYVWSVLADRDGSLWVGTEGGGLAHLDGGAIDLLGTAGGLASDSVTALWQDRDGALWVGTRDAGLDRLRDGRIEHFTTAQGLTGQTVLTLYQDPAGELWAGTLNGGVDSFDGRRFAPVESAGMLDEMTVLALGSDGSGNLLAGTNGQGLIRLGDGVQRTWTTADGLAHDTVLTLLGDEDGTVWIGTYGGLSRLREGELTSFTTDQGLFSDVIFQILEDDRGRLWMSCNQGVFAVAKEELEEVAAGRRERVESLRLGAADGMRSAECNGGGQPSGVRTADGWLWFATVRGIAGLAPDAIRRNLVPPGVVIESVLVDGEARPVDQPLDLGPGLERLEIFYTGASFRSPSRVRFRYRLEGFDRDWIDAGDQRRATYTNLPTGRRYRFDVMAANEDGVWSPVVSGVELSIARHVWETPWFVLLVLVAAAMLARLAYGLRVRQLLHRTQELEAKVAERTAEVVAQRDELEQLNQVKSEFLAIAAHDIKNPLSLIFGYAGLIADRGADNRNLRAIGSSIGASVSRILNIVKDLLDTTAIESGKLTLHVEDTDLEEAVALALERNRPLAAEREIQLAFETGGDDPVAAPVDRERFGRVLDNLVGNAIKYTHRRTTVTVRLEQRQDSSGTPVARMEIHDEGPGIAEEAQGRIFERFERLADQPYSRAPSTGLGLSIVKHFVELHHGRVWVESHPGQGSTFIVEVPAAQDRSSLST
ncbi:MAG: hypothetical protein KDD11_01385 [Acidobacteria bacterium]|nr:hypothetical protein [Acidobacteriota bacterium]